MHRIDSLTRDVDLHGPGKDGFTEGDPLSGVAATELTADWFNAVQEEVAGACEHYAPELDKASNDQLLGAILRSSVLLALSNLQRLTLAGGFADRLYAASRTAAGRICLVGAAGEIQTSDDGGDTWTQRAAANGYSGIFRDVAAAGAVLVAVGSGGEIQTSAGGSVWTKRVAGSGYAGTFNAVASRALDELFCAVGGAIQTSPDDGVTWTQRQPANGYAGAFNDVDCTEGGTFCAVGNDGEIQTSADGVTWVHRESGTAEHLYQVLAFGPDGNRLLVAGANGTLLLSEDGGATWTAQVPADGYSRAWLGLAARRSSGTEWLVAVGEGGQVQASFDGQRWWHIPHPSLPWYLYGAAEDGYGAALVMGEDGTLFRSLRVL